MTIAPETISMGITRRFTTGVHPYDEVTWEKRDVKLAKPDGTVVFHQPDVEVPDFWGQNATQILAQKYFRGNPGTPERETSLRQVIDRIVGAIQAEALSEGYLDEEESQVFADELTWLLLHQRAAFNSPVWFNVGAPGRDCQVSACFILGVEDDMESILNWYVEEGKIFKGGSGAGINLSDIRSSKELLSTGGTPSGPVSFMRGADASAGTIKSGGATRRAAKMVVLDVDHPDIRDFIWCKAKEERKIRALAEAGFDMGVDGADIASVQFQNANNSVRLSDEFMLAVETDGDWALTARTDGRVIETVKARELFNEIARAAWECADPGVQFSTTINRWNTTPASGEIRASNPCSEHIRLDNSACNLSSINLLSFFNDGVFDIGGFRHAVRVMTLAQEVLISLGDYPTEKIAEVTKTFRDIGVGYANMGALLMSMGLAYDSVGGREIAAAITAILTGEVYATSAGIAGRVGPFAAFEANREALLDVLDAHRNAISAARQSHLAGMASEMWQAASAVWHTATYLAGRHGVRNAEATVIAPTGTISLLMGCETTGVEPAFGLVSYKALVGGGSMTLPTESVTTGLRALGYNETAIAEIAAYVAEHGSLSGAPGFDEAHLPVFATSLGDNPISPMGHVAMIGAIQPFLSGAVSKTCNLPAEATVEDIADLYRKAWESGVKCLAIYRDGCKSAQPLSVKTKAEKVESKAGSQVAIPEREHPKAVRERLPRHRTGKTFAFKVGDCEGYATVGEYTDGRPGEVFMKVSKQGSTLAGIMDAFSISVSLGLQHGVPLSTYVRKYTNMRFEPAGMTDDPDIRFAASLIDYIFRRLALDYLDREEREDLGVLSISERSQPTLPGMEELAAPPETAVDAEIGASTDHSTGSVVTEKAQVNGSTGHVPAPVTTSATGSASGSVPAKTQGRDAPLCYQCGTFMQRAGSCYVCSSCGTTSGCS